MFDEQIKHTDGHKAKNNTLKVRPWKYRYTIGMKLFNKSQLTNNVSGHLFLILKKKEMLPHTFKFY